MMDKLFLSSLNNMCKQVNELQLDIRKAERRENEIREKRMRNAKRKYKLMLKSFQKKKLNKDTNKEH